MADRAVATIPELDRLTETSGPPLPVTLHSGPGWLVRSYDDVRAVLTDRRFSADDTRPGFPHLFAMPNPPGGFSFLRMDAPRHDVLRRVLTPLFTVRRIEAMGPAVTQATTDLLDGLRRSGPPADLVEDFALPLPSQVICLLLGVPYQDHAMFQAHSRVLVSVDASPQDAQASFVALGDYLLELGRAKRQAPADDLLSRIVENQDDADMSDDDVAAMARLMLIAGHETTANMLGMIMLKLFHQPSLMDVLRANPELAGQAVEEMLREQGIIRTSVTRVAIADVEVGGITVRAGQGVVLGLRGANHDPAVFPDPDTIDLERDARSHVAFGYGIHQCLGQALARLELRIALTQLLQAFPDLRAAVPLGEIRLKESSVITGLENCPITW